LGQRIFVMSDECSTHIAHHSPVVFVGSFLFGDWDEK
jgi:hypothetical protein